MKNSYDVVIVGAGMAGLECAKNLVNSSLKVLLIEKNKNFYQKVCAAGITYADLQFIPRKYLNFDFKKIFVHYKNKTILFPRSGGGIITTINRSQFLEDKLKSLKRYKNLEILVGSEVSKIMNNHCLKLKNGRKFNFKYLVGADGAISIIRKYLGLNINKLLISGGYFIKKRFPQIEFYLDDHLWGYFAIFPYCRSTLVGWCIEQKFLSEKKLNSLFALWLKQKQININGTNFVAACLNYDYQGYRFDNIFLAGDAAGLTSGFTGKGIYAAMISGKQIAHDILGRPQSVNLINDWSRKKRLQEMFWFFIGSHWRRKFFLPLGMAVLTSKINHRIARKVLE